jgi:hypothetical protein
LWVFLKCGFFSVVADTDDPDVITVRARARDDLDRLREQYLPQLGPTRVTVERDYRARAVTTREGWAVALVRASLDLDYSNFKHDAAKRLGPERARTYERVWATMCGLR